MIQEDLQLFLPKSISTFIRKENYEPVINDILNQSKLVFPSSYSYFVEQAHGESDFCAADGSLFDSKLLFVPNQCYELHNLDLFNAENFMQNCLIANNEFYDSIVNGSNLSDSLIVKETIRLISKTKENENLILIMLFPFSLIQSNSITDLTLTNYFDLIYNEVKNLLNGRNLFFIFPTLDHNILLLDMKNNKKEIIVNEPFISNCVRRCNAV